MRACMREEILWYSLRMAIDPKLIELQKHTHNNEIEILHSKTCSCIFCRQTYDARTVNDWINDEHGMSAICPECGMDAVIGDNGGEPLDKVTLKELNLAYYGEDYMVKHPDAAEKYVIRYQEGKITHKKTNEGLYIQYLSLLAEQGNGDAAFDLGQLYEFGDEFVEKDPKTAFSYYASNSLRNDGDALTRLGVLSISGALGKIDERGAYEAFAKGMAMGSLKALIHFSDCYMNGIGTNIDSLFAFDVLISVWEESYQRFMLSTGKDINVFPDLCYRLGMAYEMGLGVQKDIATALRFYLLSEFSYQLKESVSPLIGEDKDSLSDVMEHIEKIANLLGVSRQDPAFDNDTFSDSILSTNPNSSFLFKMTFIPGNFNQEENTFEFDVKYSLPPLIVDIGNLYCGFVPGVIHWRFADVSEVQAGKNRVYDRVEGDPDTGWAFLSGFGEAEETVASISFFHNDEEDGIKQGVPNEEEGKKNA